MGAKSSGECSVLVAPVNPGGLTPTIVIMTLPCPTPSLIVCPSTAGERPKSRSHSSSLITTTGLAPGAWSSEG